MKRIARIVFAVLLSILFHTGTPHATPLVTGDNEAEIFSHSPLMVGIKQFDLYNAFQQPGSVFGFFFENNPSNGVPMFLANDQLGSIAIVDFNTKLVFNSNNWLLPFSGSGDIGFFIQTPANGTFFTKSSLNPLGIDFAAVLPDPQSHNTFSVDFIFPGVPLPLSIDIVGDITPVPEPSTVLMIGIGLLAIALPGRRFLCRSRTES